MKKATMKKAAPKQLAPQANLAPKSILIQDVTLANAVKVGVNQLNYVSAPTYVIKLSGNILEIRKDSWKESEKSTFTTLYNAIFWREK